MPGRFIFWQIYPLKGKGNKSRCNVEKDLDTHRIVPEEIQNLKRCGPLVTESIVDVHRYRSKDMVVERAIHNVVDEACHIWTCQDQPGHMRLIKVMPVTRDHTTYEDRFRPSARIVVVLDKLYDSSELRDFCDDDMFEDEGKPSGSPRSANSEESLSKSE